MEAMSHYRIGISLGLLVLSLGLAGCAGTPTVQQGPGAEITYDGLHRVDNTRMDKVWIKPDIDLSRYDSIMMQTAGIQYRPADAKNRYDRNASSFPLDETQKARLRDAIAEVMADELSRIENYSFTNEPGPGVLKVTVALMDVVSRIPPEIMSARSSIYIDNLGSAVFVIEISDAQTDESLARVVDRQEVEPAFVQESNPVTNLNEVRRSARLWGARLRAALDELHDLGCYVCSVPGSTN